MPEQPTLVSDQVILRPWHPDDAVDLHTEIQDREVVRWLDIELPYTLADATGFIAKTADQWEQRRAAHFAIAEPANGAFQGYLGVLAVDDGMRVVEIVYWVAATARGRSVATSALRLVLPWIVETLAPERIELGMVDGNVASASVAEANGFVLHEVAPGAATLDGAPADELLYRWRGLAGGR